MGNWDWCWMEWGRGVYEVGKNGGMDYIWSVIWTV